MQKHCSTGRRAKNAALVVYPPGRGPDTRPRSAAALPVGGADHARRTKRQRTRRSRKRRFKPSGPGPGSRRGTYSARPPPLLRAALPWSYGRRGGHEERRPPARAGLCRFRWRWNAARRGLYLPHPRPTSPGLGGASRSGHAGRLATAERLLLNAWRELSVENLSGRCPRTGVGLPNTDPEGKGITMLDMDTFLIILYVTVDDSRQSRPPKRRPGPTRTLRKRGPHPGHLHPVIQVRQRTGFLPLRLAMAFQCVPNDSHERFQGTAGGVSIPEHQDAHGQPEVHALDLPHRRALRRRGDRRLG